MEVGRLGVHMTIQRCIFLLSYFSAITRVLLSKSRAKKKKKKSRAKTPAVHQYCMPWEEEYRKAGGKELNLKQVIQKLNTSLTLILF